MVSSGHMLLPLPPPPSGRTGWPWEPTGSIRYSPAEYPRVSVITPSYNQGAYIEETIRSVLLQNYPNVEYIVIDGGSTDETFGILERYHSFIAYWESEPDRGQANAINKGFAHSTGQIMGWLNSDDMLAPGALYHIAHAFMGQPEVQVITGLRKIIDKDGRFVRNSLEWLPERKVLERYCIVAQEATYWRRGVWETIGALDESYDFAVDYDYWQRMMQANYRFTVVPRYLGLFRKHEEAKSSAHVDVRTRELNRLYPTYAIAENEDNALEQLNDIIGRRWRQKVRLLKELGHKPISNNAALYLRLFRLLNLPLVGEMIVVLHQQYSRLRNRKVDW